MLRERVAVAAIGIPALLLVLLVGQPLIGLVILGAAGLAAHETFALLRRAGYVSEPAIGIAITLLIVASAWIFADRTGESAAILAVGIVAAAVAAFARSDPFSGFQSWLATTFGSLYAGLLGFLLLLVGDGGKLPAGAPIAGWVDGGRAWLLVAVLGVWAFDSGAYVAGRRWGRRRFAGHLSPSKTVEGVAGGLVAATAVSLVTLWAAGQPVAGALVLGPLIGLAAQAGDLAESMLKRAATVKDASNLIPGHGGMLDRVDSLLFAGPAVYFYLLTLGVLR